MSNPANVDPIPSPQLVMARQMREMFQAATKDYTSMVRFAIVQIENYFNKKTILDQAYYATLPPQSAKNFINKIGEDLGITDGRIVLKKTIHVFNVININKSYIYKRTSSCMAGYLSEYKVTPKEIEYMKMVFWSGIVLEEFLTGYDRAIIRMCRLLLMDLILQCNTSDPVPEQAHVSSTTPITQRFEITGHGLDIVMLNKLWNSIIQDRHKENYGRYGEYSIFKNCSRMCSNTCRVYFLHPNRQKLATSPKNPDATSDLNATIPEDNTR
ncbi:MAG: hypothetical protein HQL95_06600 [Magnetococcales bacterium]|nr:hypothetical protein [Magnetococcales bacterium]